jgi:GNAT superfamily N-acetyltransferase
MIHSRLTDWTPTAEYYDCRFEVLRKPLGFERGAEILSDDFEAAHAYVEIENKIVSVGRAHLIPSGSDGSQADHAGPDSALCPAFGPLSDEENRPAIQIRQMGTLTEHRGKGYAAEVLAKLESSFDAKVGFLQARIGAIDFYQSQGWFIIDEEFSISGIGPHRSMMKKFS